jgi:hypothetical protein
MSAPPGNEKAALAGGPLETVETVPTVGKPSDAVKSRYRGPVAVSDLAEQTLIALTAACGCRPWRVNEDNHRKDSFDSGVSSDSAELNTSERR